MMIFDSVSDFIFGLLHHEKHHGKFWLRHFIYSSKRFTFFIRSVDEESSDENKDVPEPFGSDVGEDAKKRRKKKR